MPTLLYGLATPPELAPPVSSGVGGAPVRHLPCGGVAAIVSTVPAKPDPQLHAIQAHDAVLQALVGAGATVAAVRFAQTFRDDEDCCAQVRSRAEAVSALLHEHSGCVEMRVLLPVQDETPAPAPTPGVGPGRAYLESLRSRGGVPSDLALKPMLGPLVRAERVEGFAAPSGRRGIAFAHLVHRDDLSAYRRALLELPALRDSRVVGPLPLYSFAEPLRG